ncbi:MAG: PilZ domain-containing protein [Thermodesulfobacteriota bacterium]
MKTNDTASIRCPQCGLVRNIGVGKLRNVRHTFKIRCSCGHTFIVSLDFRKHYRKLTALEGTYSVKNPLAGGSGQMQINNISRGGVEFSVSGHHTIEVDHRIVIEFELDNRKRSKISQKVIVRGVRDNKIGCEFFDRDPIDKDLGFYIRA